ncbi:MAG: hypothetical protein JWP42_3991, partial [Pseudomonas sp.]|nr:hypothetical protein [Pseudomonas sp.]
FCRYCMDVQHLESGMSKQKKQQQAPREMTSLERLGLRVSAMINSPIAQFGRKVMIHRLDTDDDAAWDGVMELLAETDGLEMTFNDDGSVTLKWEMESDDDRVVEKEELDAIEEPAPF